MRFQDSTPSTTGFDGSGWHRSTYSGPNGGTCVEVNSTGPRVGVRDSKLTFSPVLTFSPPGWRAFLDLVRQDSDGT
ncbi:DUF397 domain-containing protein [Amycolatopsis azurea]|uniref:DUF397 domain-containing protein n=1 Tax=Amycolatopsis azurea TaxID=36819 RepID=UPI00382536E5